MALVGGISSQPIRLYRRSHYTINAITSPCSQTAHVTTSRKMSRSSSFHVSHPSIIGYPHFHLEKEKRKKEKKKEDKRNSSHGYQSLSSHRNAIDASICQNLRPTATLLPRMALRGKATTPRHLRDSVGPKECHMETREGSLREPGYLKGARKCGG